MIDKHKEERARVLLLTQVMLSMRLKIDITLILIVQVISVH